jgi:hypothetical protein
VYVAQRFIWRDKTWGKFATFSNKDEAEKNIFNYRDSCLTNFSDILNNNKDSFFNLDFKSESLKTIEKLYFLLYERDEFSKRGISREAFERGMSLYFGEVSVRNNDNAKWIVGEYPFVKDKYQLGIEVGPGRFMIMHKCKDLCFREGNKLKQSLYREYKKYFIR